MEAINKDDASRFHQIIIVANHSMASTINNHIVIKSLFQIIIMELLRTNDEKLFRKLSCLKKHLLCLCVLLQGYYNHCISLWLIQQSKWQNLLERVISFSRTKGYCWCYIFEDHERHARRLS